MSAENYLLEAIETVLAWDLPDETFAETVLSQARLMAGISPEDEGDDATD